jgi:hypothetical protein
MAPRISTIWVLIAVALSVIAFFGYHIFQAYGQPKEEALPTPINQMATANPMVSQQAPVYMKPHPIPVPQVPAQTEEDLRETRPVNQTPPEIYYPEPEAVDPYETSQHNDAYFGDNLRHPEQMMEAAPPVSTGNIVSSGLGAHVTYQGGNDGNTFDPEMAQNGGEFMSGIVAFDGSDGGGIGYSSL